MPRRPSRMTPLLAVAALTVLLSGCFSVESSFNVHDDATADVSYLVLIDTDQLGALSGMLGEEAGDLGDLSGEALLDEMMGGEDPCGELESDLAGYDITTTEIEEGSEVGVRCTVANVPLAEINEQMESEDGTSFHIEQDETGTRFNATFGGVDELGDMGGGEDMGEMGDMLDMSFEDMFSLVIKVSAPGSLGDNNATSTDGATASWSITPDAPFVTGGDAEMFAEWTPGGGDSSGSAVLWIILGIVAAIVVAGLIFFLVKRKGDSGPSADGSARPGDTPESTATFGAPPVAPGASAPTAPMTPPAAPTPPPPPAPGTGDVPPAPPTAPPTPPS